MKKYVRSANKLTNKATQFVSKKFSNEEIARRAATGERKGESMAQIFNNIMHDPHVTVEESESGNRTLYYDGKNIGWVNFERGMGWIDDKAYAKIEKYVAPEPEFYEESEDEDMDEDWEDFGDEEY